MELATPQITSSTQEDPRPGEPASARRPLNDRGTPPPPTGRPDAGRRRRRTGRLLDVDPTLVRIGFVALTLLVRRRPLYLAGWLLIPDEDADLSVAEELLERERIR